MKLPFLKSKPKEAAVKAPEKKAVAAPVKKPAPAAVPPAKNSNKNTLFTGLAMIVIAFVGVCVIFYFLNNSVQAQEAKIKNMIEDLAHLSEEKNILELEVQNLKAQGDSIKLDKLLAQTESVYDDDEKNRKEGILWINPKEKTWVVTLGALNGIQRGSYVAIYDGAEKVGNVEVTMPLDVISYVQPVEQWEQKSEHSHYRAVIE